MRHFLTQVHLCLVGGICLCASAAGLANTDTEKRLAEAAISSAPDSSAQWLDGSKGKFLALFDREMTGSPQGGAILLPPLGAHPNWPGVVRQLRSTLPRYGWSILTIQMPTLDTNQLISDYKAALPDISQRINAAIAFLHSKGIRNIALIGKGLGAAGAAAFLANNPDIGAYAFIGISMSGYRDAGDWLHTANSIRELRLPILDIYGSHDNTHVLNSVDARADAARLASLNEARKFKTGAYQGTAIAESAQTRRTGYIAFRRLKITGADNRFSGAETQLVKRIIGWLKQHASGQSINKRNS